MSESSGVSAKETSQSIFWMRHRKRFKFPGLFLQEVGTFVDLLESRVADDGFF